MNRVPRIVVVGSLVSDLVLWVPRLPRRHETLLATAHASHAGGKGLCQAVSARRCGADVAMVGRVGTDDFGLDLLGLLDREGVDRSAVSRDEIGTSLGIPLIDPNGNNAIIGVPRANARVTVADVEQASEAIAAADVLLLQMEVPLDACHAAVTIAEEAKTSVVWNPAPAEWGVDEFLPQEISPFVSWLTPNEIEASELSSVEVSDHASALRAANCLNEQRPGIGVVVTLGGAGAVVRPPAGRALQIKGHEVDAVDTTGAGDAFNGAFATALAERLDLAKALEFATAAGALATTVVGAAAGLPLRSAIQAQLHSSKIRAELI